MDEVKNVKEDASNDIFEIEIGKMISTRYNVVKGIVEYSKDKGKIYEPLTDRMVMTIIRRLKAKGYEKGVNETLVRTILCSDFSPEYNPFLDYFTNLPAWDGTTNHIADLCSMVKVTNSEHWLEWVTKWTVGVVAGCINDKVANQQVLVITGGQGIGKTTWLNYFIPAQLADYASTGFLNPSNKDALIKASECMLVNMDELASFTSGNIESLKQLITQKTINERRPYARNAETMVKRASFCGSTNQDMFLFDEENRRLLCFKAEDVDLETLPLVNIDQVYAQAYAMYNDGFQFWFDKKENMLIALNNENFTVRSVEEEAILNRFKAVSNMDENSAFIRMTATDIMSTLKRDGLIPNSTSTNVKVGIALKKLGFKSSKSNGRLLYSLQLVA